MNCREFKSKHVGFIDDVLSAADMAEMRRHTLACTRCATLDVRIRRSLMVVRNLPQIEPSADFFLRLSEALKHAPPAPKQHPASVAGTFFAVTASLAAAVYFAMAVGVERGRAAPTAPVEVVAVAPAPPAPPPISEAALAAAVPAGVTVWPAMFMVGELPMQLANAELMETGIGR